MKTWMWKKRYERLAPEEEVVEDGDPAVGTEQLRGQEGTDITRAACDQHMPIHYSNPSSFTLYPSTTREGTSLSCTTAIPCSIQVSLQISATSPSPII